MDGIDSTVGERNMAVIHRNNTHGLTFLNHFDD